MQRNRIAAALMTLWAIASPVVVRAQDLLESTGLSSTAGEAGYEKADPDAIAGSLIQSLFGFAGVLFVVLFIYSGFLWMTSQGDSEKIKKAKGILRNAVVGLILMFTAYVLVRTVARVLSNDLF